MREWVTESVSLRAQVTHCAFDLYMSHILIVVYLILLHVCRGKERTAVDRLWTCLDQSGWDSHPLYPTPAGWDTFIDFTSLLAPSASI